MQKYNKQVRNASNSSLEYMYAHGCDVVVHTRHYQRYRWGENRPMRLRKRERRNEERLCSDADIDDARLVLLHATYCFRAYQ